MSIESDFEKVLDDIIDGDQVNGVVISDATGYALGHRGTLQNSLAASFHAIGNIAKQLPGSDESGNFAVYIETDQTKLLLSTKDNITTTLKMTNN